MRRPVKRGPKTKEIVVKHALRRALERYNVRLTPQQLDALAAPIRKGLLVPLVRQSQTRRIYVVDLQGQPAMVVYDRTVGSISTFLRPEWVVGESALEQ